MQQQSIEGSDLIQERSFQGRTLKTFQQGRTLKTFQHGVRGSNLAPKMALLMARSGVDTMADSNMQDTLSPPLQYQSQTIPLEVHGTQRLRSLMSIDMRDEGAQKRCVPAPQQMKAIPMAVGTWRMDYLMAIGMQQTGIKPMIVGARRSGDNLDTEVIHSYQQKMITMQRMVIRLMVACAQRMDPSPKAEANHYMREAWQKGKSMKNASTQQTNFDLMVVLQRTIKPRVGVEHQTTIYLRATRAQWTNHGLMVVLQWIATPRLSLVGRQILSVGYQRTVADYGLMAVLQWMVRPRVVAWPQAVGSPVTKNAHLCRRPPPQRKGSTKDSPNKREVGTIFGRSLEIKNS